MALIAERFGLISDLREYVCKQERPVWGTCAGLIFLANKAIGQPAGHLKASCKLSGLKLVAHTSDRQNTIPEHFDRVYFCVSSLP